MFQSQPHARSRARSSSRRTPAAPGRTRLLIALALAFPALEAPVVTLFRDTNLGFDPAELRLDAGRFQNGRDGQFGLALTNAGGRPELQIVYQPVPEPATSAMIFGGLAAAAAWRRGSRR